MDSRDPAAPPWEISSPDRRTTQALAAALGQVCRGGEVLGLVGSLGVGKTAFVQGLAIGLEVPPDAYVRSPTFALVNHHDGRVPLHHVDLYRLEDPDEAVFIGYEDLFDSRAVVAIEWFERFPELWPRGYLRIDFEEPQTEGAGPEPGDDFDVDHGQRRLRVSPVGEGYADLCRRWRDEVESG